MIFGDVEELLSCVSELRLRWLRVFVTQGGEVACVEGDQGVIQSWTDLGAYREKRVLGKDEKEVCIIEHGETSILVQKAHEEIHAGLSNRVYWPLDQSVVVINGATASGKSTLMFYLALRELAAGRGVQIESTAGLKVYWRDLQTDDLYRLAEMPTRIQILEEDGWRRMGVKEANAVFDDACERKIFTAGSWYIDGVSGGASLCERVSSGVWMNLCEDETNHRAETAAKSDALYPRLIVTTRSRLVQSEAWTFWHWHAPTAHELALMRAVAFTQLIERSYESGMSWRNWATEQKIEPSPDGLLDTEKLHRNCGRDLRLIQLVDMHHSSEWVQTAAAHAVSSLSPNELRSMLVGEMDHRWEKHHFASLTSIERTPELVPYILGAQHPPSHRAPASPLLKDLALTKLSRSRAHTLRSMIKYTGKNIPVLIALSRRLVTDGALQVLHIQGDLEPLHVPSFSAELTADYERMVEKTGTGLLLLPCASTEGSVKYSNSETDMITICKTRSGIQKHAFKCYASTSQCAQALRNFTRPAKNMATATVYVVAGSAALDHLSEHRDMPAGLFVWDVMTGALFGKGCGKLRRKFIARNIVCCFRAHRHPHH